MTCEAEGEQLLGNVQHYVTKMDATEINVLTCMSKDFLLLHCILIRFDYIHRPDCLEGQSYLY